MLRVRLSRPGWHDRGDQRRALNARTGGKPYGTHPVPPDMSKGAKMSRWNSYPPDDARMQFIADVPDVLGYCVARRGVTRAGTHFDIARLWISIAIRGP